VAVDTRGGTRGGRQPRAGLMLSWVNKTAAGRIRRKGGARFLGFNALVLTTIGRKSGSSARPRSAGFPARTAAG